MIFNTKCKECNKPLVIEAEYNDTVRVNCSCHAQFNYTRGEPIERPEHLDVVIYGGGFDGTLRVGTANGKTVN